MYKSIVRRIMFGILFIGLGIALIGQVAKLWDLRDYSNGWWAIFIIVPGLAGIIISGFEFWNVTLVIIGGWLYGEANNMFGMGDISRVWIIGILLIILGFKIIVGTSHKAYKKIPIGELNNGKFNENSEDYPEYNCVFSNLNIINKSQNLKGGTASSVFGKMVIDLREVTIQNNICFEVNSVFGGLDVLMPKSLPVRLNMTPVFGNYHNFTSSINTDKNAPYIELKGAAVFGNINVY
jgi:predicted membrane protein